MDFLSEHYKHRFLPNPEEIIKCVESLPNKELSKRILDAISENYFLNDKDSISKFYNFERIKLMIDKGACNEDKVYSLISFLHKIPQEVWSQMYVEKRYGNLEINRLRNAVIEEMDLEEKHTKELLNEIDAYINKYKALRYGCPWVFSAYEDNGCSKYQDSCSKCWYGTINKTFYGE